MEHKHTHHINYQIPIVALIILIIGLGLYCFIHIKTSLYPEVAFPKIKIIMNAGQEPVEKMIATVTAPIENSIKKTEGLDYVSSTTSRGACEISVFLKWGTDIDKAKQQIESFVNQEAASLNSLTNIRIEKMNTSILPVIAYTIVSKRGLVELRNIAEYQIKPFLSEVDGVSKVEVLGGKTKEYQIVVKPERLSKLNISLSQIQTVIAQENIFQSNGFIRDHNRLYQTLTNNKLENTEELKNLVIENSATRLVLLKDVADLQLNEAKEYMRIHSNGEEKPLIAITKQHDANMIEVSKGLEEHIKQLETFLPKDVKLVPIYKQATFANSSIKSIQIVLWLGLALSLIIVIMFLRSFAASSVVFFSIPFSLTLTLILLYLFGFNFNIMTLGAIAASIGLVIDDVVIVVEQIHKNREEYPDKKLSMLIAKSIRFLLPAMIASSLSTIVIFVPYILMSGVAGAYFKVWAFTMIFALISSFVVSWWITPLLFLFLISKKAKINLPALPKTNWIKYVLGKPIIAVTFICFCGLCLIMLPAKLKTGFLPEMDESNLLMNFQSPAGTDLEETNRMLTKVDAILKKQAGVEHYSRRLGTRMGIHITEPNMGDFLIQLNEDRKKSSTEIASELREKIEAAVPALNINLSQVMKSLLGDLMSNAQPIEIKVFGDDKEMIDNLSYEIAEQVRLTQGTTDASDGLVITGPEINIRPNVALLAQLGMNPSDFQFQMQTQIEGSVISTIIDKDQVLNVRIIYPDAQSMKIHSLENTNILLPNGSLKPLSSVATIELAQGEAQVHRENQKMMGLITAGLSQRDLGSTLKEIKERIIKNIHLPTGYHIEYAGSYSQQQQSFKELLLIFILGLCLVSIVILFLFKKIRIAIQILFLTGMGVAGSILALYVTNTPLNVASYTGIIIIAGIIGENSIFTYLQFQEARKTMSLLDSISYSVASRLRPKLLTVFAALLAFIPLASGMGTSSQVHQPLAISVIGGLVFALPVLLIVLPTLEKYYGEQN